MILTNTSKGAVRSDGGTLSWAEAEEEGLPVLRSAGRVIKWKPMEQKRRPRDMIGME
jgi:hypothetical protein